MPLRLIFMGTPDFAVPTLRVLLDHGHQIVAVYTRPTKPADRGMKLRPTAVEQEARMRGIPVLTPTTLRTREALEQFSSHRAHAAVVVAYGLLLPKEILDTPKFGCFNLHASLLPRWRGAAPIQRAIMEGDVETGVMVMKMDVGLDTGDVALAERVEITDVTTATDLNNILAKIGANLMAQAMDDLEHREPALMKQHGFGETYASKIDKTESRIDWRMPAHRVLRLINGLFPNAWCEMPIGSQTVRVRILRCELAHGGGSPGQLLDHRLTVACGQGAIRILELQKAGGAPMNVNAFQAGARLGPPLRLH
jgi:methionyl-tRNA formyltransferase